MTYPNYEYAQPAAPTPPPRPRHAGRYIVSVLLAVLFAGTAVLIATNRQLVIDVWTALTFTPNATLQAYIDRSTMTEHGSFLFEASEPTVAGAEAFNAECANLEPGSGVLGCYTNDDKRITLFDITDERLDGMEEVVASHEMLHAAWDRMSQGEHDRLAVSLEAEATKLAADPEFAARMELYARTEPGQRLNELHSIIGTEIADLSPALEAHYAQFFTDRAALVALHVTSITVFNELEAATAALIAEMDALQASMKADLETYNTGYDRLNGDINDFNRRADAGEFESQEQFDQERAALLQRQATLDALFADVKAREALWNEKHAQLEALNAQAAALNTSINVVPRTTDG